MNRQVQSIPVFANCLGAELLSWTELVDKDENTDLNYDSLGIRLNFGNGHSISVYSDHKKDDTCTCEGLPNNMKEKVHLRRT